VGAFATELARLMGDVPLSAGFADKLIKGTDQFTETVRKALARAGEKISGPIGLDAVPLDEAQVFASRLIEKNTANIGEFARTGVVAPGQSAADILAASQHPLTDRQATQSQIDFLQQTGIPLYREKILNRANAAYAANPDDPEAFRNAAVAAEGFGHLLAEQRNLKLGIDDLAKSMIAFGAATRGAFENNFAKGIGDAIRGTGTLRDVLLGFTNDVIDAFSQFAAHNLTQALLGDFLIPQKSGQSGPLGGLLGDVLKGLGGLIPAAHGAVYPHHFIPFQAFADGGVARRPTLGLIGEAGYPEAVVPMPQGGIPVHFTGGATSSQSREPRTYIVKSEAEARQKGYRPDVDDIVHIAAADIMSGGKLHRAIKRKLGSANQS
jgi:hypothetical protein